MKKLKILISALCFVLLAMPLLATPVLFPVNSLFGGQANNRPLTITAVNQLLNDGTNLYAGSYTIAPASTTNFVLNLQPNSYLLNIAGVTKPVRFIVPQSTNTLDVATLITGGALFYYGTNGLANFVAGTGVVLATNADGSITVNSPGATATNVFFIGSSTVTFTTLGGSNQANVPALTFDTYGIAATMGQNGTNLAAAIGLNATNLVAAVGQNNTNLSLAVSNGAVAYATSIAGSTTVIMSVGQNNTNLTAAVGQNATNLVAAVGQNNTNLTAAVGQNVTNLVAAVGVLETNLSLAVSNGAVAYAAGIGLASTNLTAAVGLNSTNLAAAVGLNSTNLTMAVGQNNTNLSLAVSNGAVAYAAGVGLGNTNLSTAVSNGAVAYATSIVGNTALLMTVGQNTTNLTAAVGQNVTNLVAGVGLNNTNLTAAVGQNNTNLTAAVGQNATNLVAAVGVLETNLSLAVSNGAVAYAAGLGQANTNLSTVVSNGAVAYAAGVGLANTNLSTVVSNAVVAYAAGVGLGLTNLTGSVSNGAVAYAAGVGLGNTNLSTAVSNGVITYAAAIKANVSGAIGTNFVTSAGYPWLQASSGSKFFYGDISNANTGLYELIDANGGTLRTYQGATLLQTLSDTSGNMAIAGIYTGNGTGLTNLNLNALSNYLGGAINTASNTAGTSLNTFSNTVSLNLTNAIAAQMAANYFTTNQVIVAALFGSSAVNTLFFAVKTNLYMSALGYVFAGDNAGNWYFYTPAGVGMYSRGGGPIGGSFTILGGGTGPGGVTYYTNNPFVGVFSGSFLGAVAGNGTGLTNLIATNVAGAASFDSLWVSNVPTHFNGYTRPVRGINLWLNGQYRTNQSGYFAMATNMVLNGMVRNGYDTFLVDNGGVNGFDGPWPASTNLVANYVYTNGLGVMDLDATNFPNGGQYFCDALHSLGVRVGLYMWNNVYGGGVIPGSGTNLVYSVQPGFYGDASYFPTLSNAIVNWKIDYMKNEFSASALHYRSTIREMNMIASLTAHTGRGLFVNGATDNALVYQSGGYQPWMRGLIDSWRVGTGTFGDNTTFGTFWKWINFSPTIYPTSFGGVNDYDEVCNYGSFSYQRSEIAFMHMQNSTVLLGDVPAPPEKNWALTGLGTWNATGLTNKNDCWWYEIYDNPLANGIGDDTTYPVTQIYSNSLLMAWSKRLRDGTFAILAINGSNTLSQTYTIAFTNFYPSLLLNTQTVCTIHDVYLNAPTSVATNTYSVSIGTNACAWFKLVPGREQVLTPGNNDLSYVPWSAITAYAYGVGAGITINQFGNGYSGYFPNNWNGTAANGTNSTGYGFPIVNNTNVVSWLINGNGQVFSATFGSKFNTTGFLVIGDGVLLTNISVASGNVSNVVVNIAGVNTLAVLMTNNVGTFGNVGTVAMIGSPNVYCQTQAVTSPLGITTIASVPPTNVPPVIYALNPLSDNTGLTKVGNTLNTLLVGYEFAPAFGTYQQLQWNLAPMPGKSQATVVLCFVATNKTTANYIVMRSIFNDNYMSNATIYTYGTFSDQYVSLTNGFNYWTNVYQFYGSTNIGASNNVISINPVVNSTANNTNRFGLVGGFYWMQ